jgi:hypothetical protein
MTVSTVHLAFGFSSGIDITPQAGRGLTDKPIGDRYQFREKSAIFLRQAICIRQWCSSIYIEIILIFCQFKAIKTVYLSCKIS